MIYTLLVTPAGDVYCTLPSQEEGISAAHTRNRIGEIIEAADGTFSVKFKMHPMQIYNKSDFPTRAAAVLYEQGILDAKLNNYLAELELFMQQNS